MVRHLHRSLNGTHCRLVYEQRLMTVASGAVSDDQAACVIIVGGGAGGVLLAYQLLRLARRTRFGRWYADRRRLILRNWARTGLSAPAIRNTTCSTSAPANMSALPEGSRSFLALAVRSGHVPVCRSLLFRTQTRLRRLYRQPDHAIGFTRGRRRWPEDIEQRMHLGPRKTPTASWSNWRAARNLQATSPFWQRDTTPGSCRLLVMLIPGRHRPPRGSGKTAWFSSSDRV